MFKYFLSCGESDLVSNGKLLLEPLGEAAVALRDCTKLTSQCTVQNVNATYELGPGVMIHPHPGDGSRPLDTSPPPCSGDLAWKWLPFETGISKPNAQGIVERVQGLIGFDPKASFKPELIRRRRMIGGLDVKGVGDSKWLIPVARSPVMAYGFLGTRFAPAPGGQWERKIEEEDQALWELSGEVQDYLVWVREESSEQDDPRPQWADPWSINVTLQVLGVNYRIGRPELMALEAVRANPITPFFSICVLHGLTGRAEWEAWLRELQKKSGQVTNPAPEDSTFGFGAREGQAAEHEAGQAALDAVLAAGN